MPVLFPRFISLSVSLNFVYHTTHPSIENYNKSIRSTYTTKGAKAWTVTRIPQPIPTGISYTYKSCILLREILKFKVYHNGPKTWLK